MRYFIILFFIFTIFNISLSWSSDREAIVAIYKNIINKHENLLQYVLTDLKAVTDDPTSYNLKQINKEIIPDTYKNFIILLQQDNISDVRQTLRELRKDLNDVYKSNKNNKKLEKVIEIFSGTKIKDMSIQKLLTSITSIFNIFYEIPPGDYGGKLGNVIFNAYTKHLVPFTADYLKALKDNPKSNPKHALDVLLDFLGRYRKEIADLVHDPDPLKERFGIRQEKEKTNYDDLIFSDDASWKNWVNLALKQMQEIVKDKDTTVDKIICTDEDKNKFAGKTYTAKNSIKLVICDGEKKVEMTMSGPDEEYTGFYYLSLDKTNNQDISLKKVIELFKSDSMIDKVNAYAKLYRDKTLSLSDIIQQAKKDNITPVKFEFHHADDSLIKMPNAINNFWEIITTEPKEKSLKKQLCDILYDFSHSSTYKRGQAAISNWLLKSIALMHGYKLSWSEYYTPPNPNYDQRALLGLIKTNFIDECIENLILN